MILRDGEGSGAILTNVDSGTRWAVFFGLAVSAPIVLTFVASWFLL